nr:unnamed protein product [Naegleria fowleri]
MSLCCSSSCLHPTNCHLSRPIFLLLLCSILLLFSHHHDGSLFHLSSHVLAKQQQQGSTSFKISQQSSHPLSSNFYNYGLFNLSFSVAQNYPIELRLAKSDNTFTTAPLGATRINQPEFDGTFRITPLSISPNDPFQIVLYNNNNQETTVTLYRFSDVVYQTYGQQQDQVLSLYMPSQSVERLVCSSLSSTSCVNTKSNQFQFTLGPNGKANFTHYPMKIQFAYSLNRELSDSPADVLYDEFVLSSDQDRVTKLYSVGSSAKSMYMAVKCLNPSGTVCNFAFSVSNRLNDGQNNVGDIVGGSIGISLLVILIIVSVVTLIVVTICCVKKRRAAKAKFQNSTELKGIVGSNQIQIVVDGKEDFSQVNNTSSSPLLLNHVTHQNTSSTLSTNSLSHLNNADSNSSVQSLIETYRTMVRSTSSSNNSSNPSTANNTINFLSGGSLQLSETFSTSGLLKERYRVIQKIGSGSFGDCYLCHDTKKQDLKVAIKAIKFAGSDSEKIISECSKTATIQHERLVQVHELFISKELQAFCMVMKYYEGDLEKNLYKYEKPLSQKMFFQLMKQLGEGLDYLHGVKQLVHRDIKPRNVFVDIFDPQQERISVVVGDLGEAKELLSTTNNSIRGTLSYMSPEVIAHEKYGFPSDIFSLGVSLYQIITRDPLETRISIKLLSESEDKVLEEVKNKMNTSCQQFEVFYDPRLINVVVNMMRKNPQDRPTAKQIKEFEL